MLVAENQIYSSSEKKEKNRKNANTTYLLLVPFLCGTCGTAVNKH